MGEILDINENTPHKVSEVVCVGCGKRWIAVRPSSTRLKELECPQCARELPQMGKRTNVLGIGILDVPFSKNSSKTTKRAYRVWENILDRCYNDKAKKRMTTYDGCTMCEEWLMFSNFLKWFEENIKERQHIDKDILFKGNKVYSPETCCFVPSEINTLFTKSNAKRGNLPIGVRKYKRKFLTMCKLSGVVTYLGLYNTIEDAFNAYKQAKEAHIKEVAQKYFDDGKITKRVYDALMNYEVEITD